MPKSEKLLEDASRVWKELPQPSVPLIPTPYVGETEADLVQWRVQDRKVQVLRIAKCLSLVWEVYSRETQAARLMASPEHPGEQQGRPFDRAIRVATRRLREIYRSACARSRCGRDDKKEFQFVLAALTATPWHADQPGRRDRAELTRLFADRRCDPGMRGTERLDAIARVAKSAEAGRRREHKKHEREERERVQREAQHDQDQLRKLAVARVRSGESQSSVAEDLGLHKSTLSKWIKAERTGGSDALLSKRRGRPRQA